MDVVGQPRPTPRPPLSGVVLLALTVALLSATVLPAALIGVLASCRCGSADAVADPASASRVSTPQRYAVILAIADVRPGAQSPADEPTETPVIPKKKIKAVAAVAVRLARPGSWSLPHLPALTVRAPEQAPRPCAGHGRIDRERGPPVGPAACAAAPLPIPGWADLL